MERTNATRFSTMLGFEDSSFDDIKHYRGRLQETLDRLISLDNANRDLLPIKEYEEDIKTCEEYTNKTKQAIQKADRRIDNSLYASTARLKYSRVNSVPCNGHYWLGHTFCETSSDQARAFRR